MDKKCGSFDPHHPTFTSVPHADSNRLVQGISREFSRVPQNVCGGHVRMEVDFPRLARAREETGNGSDGDESEHRQNLLHLMV